MGQWGIKPPPGTGIDRGKRVKPGRDINRGDMRIEMNIG